ncbi:MAG: hypothetical protein GY727_03870 [Gammaproteobacteria bacterium]|nr:hypothetical protein [Gammaproteobacteria bacterium]MCP4090509.1 hypothetical protein [Gammaproteobacteria bacterium]MCP4276626.1 hypothetical protein [Gammaproteobacteria bacterium]MCP4831376.1 hypothetical protein [Gammaproteobacteria bacterium]MCP4927920.1 hypothetical protein [Gammaproteobacteria bacterium]
MNRPIFSVLLLISFLTGCQSMLGDRAGLDAGVPRVNTEGMKKGCFYANEADDWDLLTSVNLIIYAPTKSRPYLLTISPPFRGLRGEQTIAFETGFDGGRICGRVGDTLIMRVGVAESFQIVDVRHIDEALAEQLLSQKESGELPLVVPADGAAETAVGSK